MYSYSIDAKKHYSSFLYKLERFPFHYKQQSLTIYLRFNQTNKYILPSIPDQQDINKLCGLSWGDHGKNSARLGYWYDPNQDTFKLYLFLHKNSKQSWYHLQDIPVDKLTTLKFTFDYQSNTITASCKDKTICIRFNYPKFKGGYYLYPYFGGDFPTPHQQFYDLHFQ